MTAVQQSVLEQIPSAVVPPDEPLPTQVGDATGGFSRRRLLSTVVGITVVSGLGLLDLLPWSRPRSALAAAYEQWYDCRGYFNSSTICVPSSAYYRSSNCSGSWHRNDGSSGTCYSFKYTHDPDSCAGRNAWRWTGRVARRKCSDGWYYYQDCGGGYINRFSICRTAI